MPQASQRWLHLLRHFVVRDLRQRYLGSLWGGAWALLQPLLTLAIALFPRPVLGVILLWWLGGLP